MKTLFNYLLLAIIAIGFASCSQNDEEVKAVEKENGSAFFLFSFTTDSKMQKTADALNALASEVAVNTVDVYIYEGITFERHVSLLFSDFAESAPGSNIWVLNSAKKIAVSPGNKNVYVGINLPTKFNAFSIANEPLYMTSLDDLNKGTTGFAMFSKELVSKNIAVNTTESITIPVERLLSKVAVHTKNTTYTVAGVGTFSDMKYDINNNNKAFYLFTQKSGGFVVDPNYDWSTTDYSSNFLLGNGYISVDQAPADYTVYNNVKYTLENTTKYVVGQAAAKMQKTSTYASVSAIFTPEKVIDVTNGNTAGTEVTGVKGRTFYQILYEGGEIIYTYADNLAAATAYATSKASGRSNRINTYTNGVCYYNIFLAKNNDFDVIRNYFYVVNIDDMLVLGKPSNAIDPTAPIEGNTYLQVTVDILPWTLDIQSVILDN